MKHSYAKTRSPRRNKLITAHDRENSEKELQKLLKKDYKDTCK